MELNRLKALVETYDALFPPDKIEENLRIDSPFVEFALSETGNKRPLSPPYHTVARGRIIVEITPNGSFLHAHRIGENEPQYYIIPTTNAAETRTSNGSYTPFPLHERLKQIAYECEVKQGNGKYEKKKPYVENLSAWVNSKAFQTCSAAEKEGVLAVFKYIKKGTILKDIDDAAKEVKKVSKDNNPTVIFCVDGMKHSRGEANLARNPDAWRAYIKYASEKERNASESDKGMCYLTGEDNCRLLDNGQKFILTSKEGNQAKIFAANRTESGNGPSTGYFTYHGRAFTKPSDCATIGERTAEKVHAIFRWLIDHQGWVPCMSEESNQVVLIWNKPQPVGTVNTQIAMQKDVCNEPDDSLEDDSSEDMHDESSNLSEDDEDDGEDDDNECSEFKPNSEHRETLRKCCSGYKVPLISDEVEQVTIMVLDSASKGRVSICAYYEMTAGEYIANRKAWHEDAGWPTKWDERGNPCNERAPSVYDILRLCLGDGFKNVKSKATRAPRLTMMALQCINNREAPLPYEIVHAAMNGVIHHTQNQSEPSKGYAYFNWQLHLTCGLIRKYLNQGGANMASKLDETLDNRSYLFGRALAYFDEIENAALYLDGNKDRLTNAWRLMPTYFERPAVTAVTLMRKVNPYIERLSRTHSSLAASQQDGLNSVLARIAPSEANDEVDQVYMLLGYAAQKDALHTAKVAGAHKKESDSNS